MNALIRVVAAANGVALAVTNLDLEVIVTEPPNLYKIKYGCPR